MPNFSELPTFIFWHDYDPDQNQKRTQKLIWSVINMRIGVDRSHSEYTDNLSRTYLTSFFLSTEQSHFIIRTRPDIDA